MTREEEFVRHFREQWPDVDDETQIFLAWLQQAGPDEWHRWVIAANWDYGIELFEWIIAQPECDRGTALSLYYGSQPDLFADLGSIEEIDPIHQEIVGLMTTICKMWRQGAYANYAYRPSERALEYLSSGPEAMLALAASVPWDVPQDLATARIEGETNEFKGAVDGIPVAMLRALGEDS